MELLQNRGDHSTEANETTTTLNALIKGGGQTKQASVSLWLCQHLSWRRTFFGVPKRRSVAQTLRDVSSTQLPSAEDVEYWHGEEKAGWLQSQARSVSFAKSFWDLRSICLHHAYRPSPMTHVPSECVQGTDQLHVRAAVRLHWAHTWSRIDGPVCKASGHTENSHALCRGTTSRRGGDAGLS